MTQEPTKNLIISIVVLALIAGGIFYYQKKNQNSAVPEKQDTAGGEARTIDENKAPTPEFESTDTVAPSPSVSDNTAKFNTAMTNARTAFGKGEYPKAIGYYDEALLYSKVDTVYSGLFTVYGAQGEWEKARASLDSAIALNPLYTEYWKWKLTVLDGKTSSSFQDLQKVYEEGLLKGDKRTRVNLVTHFASIAEGNAQKSEAIALWEYAKTLYPQNGVIYQAEIDRLREKI